MSGRWLIVLMAASIDGVARRDQRHRLTPQSSRDGRRIEMGKLIATAQATVDRVIDPVGE